MTNYRYLLEEKTNKNISSSELISETTNNVCVLKILCYYIDTSAKYPFLQFMMEKIQYDDVEDELMILPHIFVRDAKSEIKDAVLERVVSEFDVFGYDLNKITEDMYKGIIYDKSGENVFALVNISAIDLCRLNYMRQTTCWFVLPSEIINTKSVCDISIDPNVTNLFTNSPHVGLLSDNKTNEFYILPDVVFSATNELKQAEFQTIFGNVKTKTYGDCGEYFYFYRTFGDAVREFEENKTHALNGVIKCVNRYALFVEGKMYFEKKNEFTLTDENIRQNYSEPCIIICFTEKRHKADMLVKNDTSFASLSYLKLTKKMLNKYDME